MSKQTKANEALWEAGLRVVQEHLRANDIKVDMTIFERSSCETVSCGTARCIGGWFSTLVLQKPYGGNPFGIVDWPVSHKFEDRLHALFFPEFEEDDEFSAFEWHKLTNKDAVKAINNFLAAKKNPWHGVVSKSRQLKGRNVF